MAKGNYKSNFDRFYNLDLVNLERYTSSFVGGPGAAINDGVETVQFHSIPGLDSGRHKLIFIKGDSMSPLIEEGDSVIIEVFRNGLKPKKGGIIAAILNGELICKIFDPASMCLYLSSINQDYPPIQVYENDSCEIVGKAWKVIKDAVI